MHAGVRRRPAQFHSRPTASGLAARPQYRHHSGERVLSQGLSGITDAGCSTRVEEPSRLYDAAKQGRVPAI